MSEPKAIDQNDKASAWRHAIDSAIAVLAVIAVPAAIKVGDSVIDAIQAGQISMLAPDWKVIGGIVVSAAVGGAVGGLKRLWERYRMDLSKHEPQS